MSKTEINLIIKAQSFNKLDYFSFYLLGKWHVEYNNKSYYIFCWLYLDSIYPRYVICNKLGYCLHNDIFSKFQDVISWIKSYE